MNKKAQGESKIDGSHDGELHGDIVWSSENDVTRDKETNSVDNTLEENNDALVIGDTFIKETLLPIEDLNQRVNKVTLLHPNLMNLES